jgi:hypothetical protein
MNCKHRQIGWRGISAPDDIFAISKYVNIKGIAASGYP